MEATVTEIYGLMTDLPAGAWVAVSTARMEVLSFGEDADLVMEQAKEKGEQHPLVTRVPDPEAALFY